MDFTLFHFYLIFFLLGLGYATVAVLMGQLLGGHEHGDVGGHEAGGHEAGGHEAGGHDFDHGGDVADAGAADVGDVDAGDVETGDIDHGEADTDHGMADVDAGDAMPNISPLSPVTIATFSTSFGGIGAVLAKAGLPGWVSFPAAGGAGFVIAVGVFYLFYRVFSITQSTSGVSARHTIGRRAEVITPIPENGVGEIAYVLGGRRFNAPARTEDGHAIRSGASVVISRKVGGIFHIEESVEERLRRDKDRRAEV